MFKQINRVYTYLSIWWIFEVSPMIYLQTFCLMNFFSNKLIKLVHIQYLIEMKSRVIHTNKEWPNCIWFQHRYRLSRWLQILVYWCFTNEIQQNYWCKLTLINIMYFSYIKISIHIQENNFVSQLHLRDSNEHFDNKRFSEYFFLMSLIKQK